MTWMCACLILMQRSAVTGRMAGTSSGPGQHAADQNVSVQLVHACMHARWRP
jgi:hypothetical protein